uniref:IPT/TIG domain-containing protein n=1 Tax=Ditylenchus dipsaci TaxID=166011 RepID=A0A915D9Z4_9BILA
MCTTSKWPCKWCSADHKCLNTREEGKETCSSSNESSKCAKIDSQSTPEILIADSTNASVSFGVLNMEESRIKMSDNAGLYCTILPSTSSYFGAMDDSIGNSRAQRGIKVQVAAVLQDDRVHCSSAFFNYSAAQPYQNYTLELAMGREMIDKTSVTVYKCSEWLLTAPSACLSILNGDAHGVREGVSTIVIPNALPNLHPTMQMCCAQPFIESMQPQVLVGGSKCKVVDYEVSKKISCIIERGSGHGPARITIGRTGKRVVESANTQHFHFQDPLPKSIYPVFGPIAGGTRLAIHGDHLSIGSNISVHLDNLPCQVVRDEEAEENSGQITCITSPSTSPIPSLLFEPNPTIESMEPRSSFESGGRMVNIKGTNFDSILSAKLYLLSSTEEPTELVSQLGLCQIHNSTQMQCQTPKLTLPPTLSSSTYSRWPIGFYMDAVRSVRNLGNTIQLTTVPDPQFSAFKGVKLQSAEQPLVIEGNYLAQAATPEDYIVTVGTEPCSVFVLEAHQLLCRLPTTQPRSTDDLGVELQDGHPLVVVKIGSIRMEIGPLEYDSNSSSMGGLVRMNLLKLVLLLLCALALLLLAALLILWLWRRRNNEHERVYKRIQMQMEQMESNVRNECKQAFAELQTDMLSDLTAAIDDGVGIPYQNKAEFVSRLLFRDSTDTSLLNGYGTSGISAYSSQLPVALAQFDSLLWNRQFVFLFVHMVETDPSVTASERSTLSSLLLASLSRNMVYCTDIILSLLSAHIERTCQADNGTGKTAHLLFRKSESLVEKLFQQWLTICMYPYLNDVSGPGKNFFLLYKALKYQTEKGPIDCVTGNARYSLSEQKLLRESVEANPVTLLIIPIDGFDQAPVVCKALSCDSISQVKSKLLDLLYKNSPFSTRIANDQFDLEWSCPKRGSILLLDDDRPQVKGLKKLNTVAYYNLPNNSLLAMQARNGTCHTGHHQSFTFRSGSSDTTCSVWSSAQLIETSNSISPVSNHNHSNCSDPSSNTTYWHLTHPNHNNHDVAGENRGKKKTRDKGNSLLQKELSMSFNGDNKASARNIPEVFLTRLLMCKGTIQKFVEGFFDSVMFVNDSSCCPPAMTDNVPIVMKYVLDFLDEEALRNNVSDPEVVHAWKTNAVVLRLWMQLIHNPDSLFDVQRQTSVDGSMVVVGQTLMDAFSRSDVPLGKESPSSKLLFAKEISKYRPIAAQMFRRVKSQQASISNKQFYEYIGAMSRFLGEGLSSTTAVGELLNWVKANGLRLVELLQQDPVAVKHRLGERLRQIVHCTIVEPEHIYATLQ